MAWRFGDSFDHYATADASKKWTNKVGTGSAQMTIVGGIGRNASAGLRGQFVNGAPTYLVKTLDAQQTWIVGFAFKATTPLTADQIFGLFDDSSLQCDLRLKADGTFSVTRNGTVLGTTVFSISSDTYYFIELKIKIDPTVGTVDLRINGDSKLSLTGQNTRATANSTANSLRLGNPTGVAGSSVVNRDFDDFYACDGTGTVNNDFLGDSRAQTLFPTGVGNYADFSRGGADSGANWSQVEETAPNGDTNYNESGSLTAKDSFAFGDLTASAGTINSVTTHAYVKKTDAGDRRLRFFVRIGGADYFSPTQYLGTDYTYYSYTWEKSPATNVAWTVSEINGAEFGYEMNF